MPASQVPRNEERDRDIHAGEAKELEWPLRQLDASVVVPRRPLIERPIELRRLVDRGDEAEDDERRRGRTQRRDPDDPRLPRRPTLRDRWHASTRLQATRQAR